MLITVKNNGKGSQGIYANGEAEPLFIQAGRSRRVTVTEDELARITRVKTLAVVNHDDPRSGDPVEDGGVKAIDTDSPTVDTDQLDNAGDDEVVPPVLDESDAGEPAPVDKPWEAASTGRKRK